MAKQASKQAIAAHTNRMRRETETSTWHAAQYYHWHKPTNAQGNRKYQPASCWALGINIGTSQPTHRETEIINLQVAGHSALSLAQANQRTGKQKLPTCKLLGIRHYHRHKPTNAQGNRGYQPASCWALGNNIGTSQPTHRETEIINLQVAGHSALSLTPI